MASFDGHLDLAKTQVALRALRYGHFPGDIFDEYAWDMLLHMYIAGLRQQILYVDNVINLTSKSTSIGNKWIKHLLAKDMVEVDGEKIKLSENAFSRMEDFHANAIAALT